MSPSLPPVMLMHGFPCDIPAYAEVAPLLAAPGSRVIVPDLLALLDALASSGH